METQFTAIIEQDGEWHIASCPEIPGANGQGGTKDEARENLAEAIALILEVRREGKGCVVYPPRPSEKQSPFHEEEQAVPTPSEARVSS